MTDAAISPLRRRMIEDMTIRNLAAKTQQGYIRTIKNLAVFLGRSPDTASFEDVRRFQLHLATSGVGVFTPGLAGAIGTARTGFTASAETGLTSVTWNPTITVTLPSTAPAGTYAGTITHSVA